MAHCLVYNLGDRLSNLLSKRWPHRCAVLPSAFIVLLLTALLTPRAIASEEEAPLHLTSLEACANALREPRVSLARDGDPSTVLPRTFYITSWNVMKLGGAGIAEALRRRLNRTDIAFLQETLLSYTAPLTAPPVRSFSAGYRRDDAQSGVEIRTRQMPQLHCSLSAIEPWLRTPKAISAIRLPLINQDLLLVNLHAINFTLGSDAYRKQLGTIGALLTAHTGPAIVGGDFNHWNSWRRLVLQRFAAKHGLSEVSFAPDWRSRHLGSPVDSFMVRDLTVVSATALPSDASDHHPIVAVLKWR